MIHCDLEHFLVLLYKSYVYSKGLILRHYLTTQCGIKTLFFKAALFELYLEVIVSVCGRRVDINVFF